MNKITLLLLLFTLFSVNTVNAQHKDSVYAFSYFIGNGEDGLHLAYSLDGLKFEALNDSKSFLAPTLSKDRLMRDPCIIRGGDGLFHMVWTVSWTDKGIGYASSRDLINWSPQQYIPVMAHEPEARNCWAPEITYDPQQKKYMIYWSTTIKGLYPETQVTADDAYNHRLYYTSTTDFKTFSDTKLLYEPGFNVIDASIVKQKDQWMMLLKDETRNPDQKNIKLAFSTKLEGPYSPAGKAITGDYWAEGPTTVKIKDQWFVYFDKYTRHQYGVIASSDLISWKDLSDQLHMPKGIRHGSIFKISQAELKKLQQAK